MVRETSIQSQFELYQRLKKWYLKLLCLTLSNIRWESRVKWSNPGKGVAPSPKPRCSSYRKKSFRFTLDLGRQHFLLTARYTDMKEGVPLQLVSATKKMLKPLLEIIHDKRLRDSRKLQLKVLKKETTMFSSPTTLNNLMLRLHLCWKFGKAEFPLITIGSRFTLTGVLFLIGSYLWVK